MATKVSISTLFIRERKFHRVRWREAGKVRRKFFKVKAAAEGYAAQLRGEQLGVNQFWSLLTQDEREGLFLIWREGKRRNVDWLALLGRMEAAGGVVSPGCGAVLTELIEAKRGAGRSKDYLTSVKAIVGRFIRGREAMPMRDVGFEMLRRHMDLISLAGRATVRSRLATWFKYGMRHGYCAANLCERLERAKVLAKLPEIFTPEQLRTCLEYLRTNPPEPNTPHKDRPKPGQCHAGAAWFILTAGAGLRPEEAMKVTAEMLHLDEERPFVELPAEISKPGQWRLIYPLPEVVGALRWAGENGAVQPFPLKHKSRLLRRLRERLGWERWAHDVTRHSAGSYWLAVTNDQKHVVEMLGNSERIFRRHYKRPMPLATAKNYFKEFAGFTGNPAGGCIGTSARATRAG